MTDKKLGCLEGYCYLTGTAKGMHTNGGCRCVRSLVREGEPMGRIGIERTLAGLHKTITQQSERIAELEAEKRDLIEFRNFVRGWRENDWPEDFCRKTAESLSLAASIHVANLPPVKRPPTEGKL